MNWLPTMLQTKVEPISVWDSFSLDGSRKQAEMCLGMLTLDKFLDNGDLRCILRLSLTHHHTNVYLFNFANSIATMVIGGTCYWFLWNQVCLYGASDHSRLCPHQILINS